MNIIDNKYKLGELIYSGQQSSVYVGRYLKGNLKLAVKVLNTKFVSDSGDLKEIFKRDSKALSLLNHQNIIEYKDSGIQEDNFYIVMEYFEGGNLNQIIQENILSDLSKLKVMLNILEGIQAAHDKRIIHRDIKPSNILVDSNLNVKIIDFGISKILDLNAYRTNYTLKDYVTKRYASPEQLAGMEVDSRTDIFSLGCVLFYLLSGVEPNENKRLIKEDISSLNCSETLKSILHKSLAYEKENRYISILSFVADIEKEIELSTTNKGTLKIFVPKIINKNLYDLGKVSNIHFDTIKSFIETSLIDSAIYKTQNNSYYLIGEEVRYQLIPEKQKGYFKIMRIFPIEKYSENEYEKSKGIELPLNLEITQTIPRNINPKELTNLLKNIDTSYKEFKNQQSQTQSKNKLIKDWEDILRTVREINFNRERIGNYKSFTYDSTRNFLTVEMEPNFDSTLIQDGDYLKLHKGNNKFVNIGQIKDVENNLIKVALKSEAELQEINKRGEARIDLSMNNNMLKRFSNALFFLRNNEAVNKDLLEILINPSQLAMKNIDLSLESVNKKIDPTNMEAVTQALKTNDIFLIQGPPGTGKSTVITEIINQILMEDPNSKVLITSPSHVAVDHLLKNIVKDQKDKRIIRIGTSEKIAKESSNLLATEQIKLWSEEVKNKSIDFSISLINQQETSTKTLRKYLQYHLKKNQHINPNEIDNALIPEKTKELVNIIKDWNNRLELIDEFDDIFAREASIVAATCVGIASRHTLRNITYDWAIIDEAARATAPELILPMLLGKKIILVGDHKQLPPIVNLVQDQGLGKNINTKKLEKSLFEVIFEKASEESRTTLTSQFRMHPIISKLVNDSFYPTYKIKTKVRPEDRQHNLNFDEQVIWIDTSTLTDNQEETQNGSYRNNIEVKIIQNKLREFNEIYKNRGESAKVAVISGYNAQKQLLINDIDPDNPSWTNLSIQIDNIDAFQGSESDIVFYSLVRSNEKNDIGFLKDERRLNVALSRGKNCLIIVGNKECVLDYRTIKGNSFHKVIKFIQQNQTTCTIKGAKI